MKTNNKPTATTTDNIWQEPHKELVNNGYIYIDKNQLAYLSLSDLISLYNYIDDEAELIESHDGDITAKLEQVREQIVLVHQEIEKRRGLIFGTEIGF